MFSLRPPVNDTFYSSGFIIGYVCTIISYIRSCNGPWKQTPWDVMRRQTFASISAFGKVLTRYWSRILVLCFSYPPFSLNMTRLKLEARQMWTLPTKKKNFPVQTKLSVSKRKWRMSLGTHSLVEPLWSIEEDPSYLSTTYIPGWIGCGEVCHLNETSLLVLISMTYFVQVITAPKMSPDVDESKMTSPLINFRRNFKHID